MAPSPNYPLGAKGKIIGRPYQGTHTMYGNWQSDNAVDIAVPVGTPVYAVSNGTINSRIGAFDSKDPHLQGLRVTVNGPSNSYYYAHLSKLAVKAGETVKAGQLLGYSGEANGVAHLHFAQENGNPLNVQGGVPPADTGGTQPAPPPGAPAAPTAPTADDLVAQDAQAIPGSPLTPPNPNATVPLLDPNQRPDLALQPGYRSSTWQSLSALPGASPDTIRLSQLANLQGDASPTP